jgi:uncharacterized membrane protein YozB (DUF420 family)
MIRRYRLVKSWPGDPALQPFSRPALEIHPLAKAHATCMVSAVTTSTLFLASYLVYHYRAGSVPFPHGGILRPLYFTILLSHTVLATVSVPLILITVFRAWRGELARHCRIAPVTFPIWLYVAVTGVVIYLMLYHMPVADSASPEAF